MLVYFPRFVRVHKTFKPAGKLFRVLIGASSLNVVGVQYIIDFPGMISESVVSC